MGERVAQTVAELERAFQAFDSNGDGRLTPHELERGLRRLLPYESGGGGAQLRQLLAAAASPAAADDGSVDLCEFVKMISRCSTARLSSAAVG